MEQILLLNPQKESTLTIPWSWTSVLQNWEKKLLLFEPPNVWHFVMAALGYRQYLSLGSHDTNFLVSMQFRWLLLYMSACIRAQSTPVFSSLSNLGDLIQFHGIQGHLSAEDFHIYTPDWPLPFPLWPWDTALQLPLSMSASLAGLRGPTPLSSQSPQSPEPRLTPRKLSVLLVDQTPHTSPSHYNYLTA